MTADELRSLQAPLKARYREQPEAALHVLKAAGLLDVETLSCRIATPGGMVAAGLHPAVGGDGSWACSGDMLLQSLVACAGVTVCAVATSMGIPLKGGRVEAFGTLDFRGTLAASRDVPVGFSSVELKFSLDAQASAEQLQKLVELTERYCVIYQTLKNPPKLTAGAVLVESVQ